MKPNRLLIVTPEIARLASELIQFQWFLDEGSIEESCDLVSLATDDEALSLLNDLKVGISEVDTYLSEICEPGLYVKADAIRILVNRLEENEDLLKKMLAWLNRHDSSRRIKKDATALKHDYAYIRKALCQWMDHDTMEASSVTNEEEAGNGGVREIVAKDAIFRKE